MSSINDALLMTSDSLMFVPLIIFCFIPVLDKIKSSIPKLIIKTIFAVIAMEILMFCVYLISISELAIIFNMLLIVVIFFWLYQREVDIECSHLWFVFVTAGLIGSFGYMIYHISNVFIGVDIIFNPTAGFHALISQILFESILIVALYYPTKKYLGWLVCHFHEERIWQIVWIFPTAFIVLSRHLIPYDNNQLFTGAAMQMYLMFLFIFLVVIIFLYIMFYQVIYRMVEKQEMLEKATYLEMQTEQFRRLKDHMEETKRIRHDFRHQLIVLERMLKNHEYQEAEGFLTAYSQDIDYTVHKYCDSAAINAVLSHYVSLCREEDISTSFSVRIEEQGILKDIDFCVLLGNLLENAVYGCANVEQDRKITLKIGQTTSNIIVLEIKNPYVGSIKKVNEKFISSRHSGEGQGLKSVRLVAEKYNGFIKVNYDNQFDVKVLLNI